jgi:hypothetical protein
MKSLENSVRILFLLVPQLEKLSEPLVIVVLTKLYHVVGGLYMWVGLVAPPFDNLLHGSTSTPSWEFFTTLDYEWSVIRGRRPYWWTIWVCADGHFISPLIACTGPLIDLLTRRFTHFRAWPPSWP